MNFLLFVDKEGQRCPSSPQLLSGIQSDVLLHLVYESKQSNKVMYLTHIELNELVAPLVPDGTAHSRHFVAPGLQGST
jgi:hypothetical protein